MCVCCVDEVNQFTCDCPDGYYGRNCESGENGVWSWWDVCLGRWGVCLFVLMEIQSAINQFTCDCPDGYYGRICESGENGMSVGLCV